jgi:hypothetical protein
MDMAPRRGHSLLVALPPALIFGNVGQYDGKINAPLGKGGEWWKVMSCRIAQSGVAVGASMPKQARPRQTKHTDESLKPSKPPTQKPIKQPW